MNRLKRFALTGLAALTLGLGTAKGLKAATLRVPSEYPTIQSAVDASQHGDEVLVARGTYIENLDIDNCISLKSESGPENTSILSQNFGCSIFAFFINHTPNNYSMVIEGFTINKGIEAITSTRDTVIIKNNILENSEYGIRSERLAPGNYIINNNIIRNISWKGIFLPSPTSAIIHDNLLYNIYNTPGNNSTVFAAIELYGGQVNHEIYNNTIVKNYKGIITNTNVRNNIIAFNTIGFVNNSANDMGCNVIFGNQINYQDDHSNILPIPSIDIPQDPLFCDLDNNNFTLHKNSPALPQNNSCNTLIGKFGENCESTPVARTSRGKLKSDYR